VTVRVVTVRVVTVACGDSACGDSACGEWWFPFDTCDGFLLRRKGREVVFQGNTSLLDFSLRSTVTVFRAATCHPKALCELREHCQPKLQ
jgi:hypothetical protein